MTAVAIYGTNRDEQQVRGSRSDYPSTQDRSAIRTCTATPTWMTTQLWPASPTARSRTRPQCGEMPPKFRQAFCAWAAWRTSRTATATGSPHEFTRTLHAKPQSGSNRMTLHQKRCAARFQPQCRRSLRTRSQAFTCRQRKDSGGSPAFAIGPNAADGNTKGTGDRMVPCTADQHQFAIANIMNHLDACPFT